MHGMYTTRGIPGITTQIAVTDEAQTLADAGMSLSIGGKNAIGAFITVDNTKTRVYSLRCTFGRVSSVTPTTSFGHLLYPGDSLYLDDSVSVLTFQFINEVQQSAAYMHVTLEYESGSGVLQAS